MSAWAERVHVLDDEELIVTVRWLRRQPGERGKGEAMACKHGVAGCQGGKLDRSKEEALAEVRALVERGPFTRAELSEASAGLGGMIPWAGCEHDLTPTPSDVDPASTDQWRVICLKCGAGAFAHGKACACGGCTAQRRRCGE